LCICNTSSVSVILIRPRGGGGRQHAAVIRIMRFENKGFALFTDEQRSTELFQSILDTMHDEVIVVSKDCRVVFANARAAERLGVQNLGSMELTCHEIHHRCSRPDDVSIHQCAVHEVLKNLKPVTSEHVVIDDFGNFIPMRMEASPIFDDTGNVEWIVQLLSEVEEEHFSHAYEHRRHTENEKNLKCIGVLNDVVAHDFNNLTAGILSNVDYLIETVPVDSPTREILLEIAKAAERAAGTIRQISSISENSFRPSPQIALNDVLEKARPDLEAFVPEHIVLRFDMDEDLPFIQGDATHLTQLVMNLISNAVDAVGASSGVIKVGTGQKYCDAAYVVDAFPSDRLKEGMYTYLEVSDTGKGMDSDTMTRIFSPFFTTKEGALGLGLKAALGIVRIGRGAVEVFSHLGEGSTFRILFPSISSTPPSRVTEAEPDETAFFSGKRILLVDDEEPIRNVAKHMLEYLGFEVETAENGFIALKIFAERKDICLVLLDLSMPKMAGEDCFAAIKEIDKDARIVMSSGHCRQDVIDRFQGKGLIGYIQKPYRLDELRAVLKEALHIPID
jgi:two-component system cell cycle sensor histidine kinase/response regulator CckA